MKWYLQHIAIKKTGLLSVLLLTFLFANLVNAQSTVKAEIDSTSIKIGAQIRYKITVETDSTNLVHFPKDQTFSPLEMVEALKIDSTKKKNRINLQRIYTLTQFDSGSYTIPPQRVQINEEAFLTDSFRVKVADVPVDTLKQNLYDIKPIIEVKKSSGKTVWMVLLILLILGLIGAVIYWFVYKRSVKKKAEKEALLPPYDRAIQGLKELENSKYLIQDEYKEYYSELTDIVRSYLEEETHINALESTTDQLIEKLELRRDAGRLDLTQDTILQFKQVLQTADLVKFAKSKPDDQTAEQDRKTVEQIVIKTKEAIPEPTLEELQQTKEFQEALVKKQQQKKWYWAIGITVFLLLLASVAFTLINGPLKTWDTITRNPSKKLFEKEWVESDYGYPPLVINTPGVLLRMEPSLEMARNYTRVLMDSLGANDEYSKSVDAISDSQILEDLNKITQFFKLPTEHNSFYLRLSETKNPELSKNLEKALQEELDLGLRLFEQEFGAKNLIEKREEFFTKNGSAGIKQYGTATFPGTNKTIKADYIILNLPVNNTIKRVVIISVNYDRYAKKIVERILTSVDVKTQG